MECWWMHSDLNTSTMLKQSHRPSSRGGFLVLEGNLQHGGHWLMSLDSPSWLHRLTPLMLGSVMCVRLYNLYVPGTITASPEVVVSPPYKVCIHHISVD